MRLRYTPLDHQNAENASISIVRSVILEMSQFLCSEHLFIGFIAFINVIFDLQCLSQLWFEVFITDDHIPMRHVADAPPSMQVFIGANI